MTFDQKRGDNLGQHPQASSSSLQVSSVVPSLGQESRTVSTFSNHSDLEHEITLSRGKTESLAWHVGIAMADSPSPTRLPLLRSIDKGGKSSSDRLAVYESTLWSEKHQSSECSSVLPWNPTIKLTMLQNDDLVVPTELDEQSTGKQHALESLPVR